MALVDFAKSVELPVPSFARAGRDASLSGGGVMSFVAGLSEQHKQDVLDSTLFAQLAATKQHDRTQNPNEWYQVYQSTLGAVGWVVTGFDFKEYKLTDTEISVDKIVLEFLGSALAPPRLAVVKSLIDALKKRDESDPVVEVFTSNSSSENDSNFQLGACSSIDGNVLFSMGSFKYQTDSKITNVLFTKLRRGSAHMFNSFQGMILNDGVYGIVRGTIADRIADYARDMIIDIPI